MLSRVFFLFFVFVFFTKGKRLSSDPLLSFLVLFAGIALFAVHIQHYKWLVSRAKTHFISIHKFWEALRLVFFSPYLEFISDRDRCCDC